MPEITSSSSQTFSGSERTPFYQTLDGQVICDLCGCIVVREHIYDHTEWHDTLNKRVFGGEVLFDFERKTISEVLENSRQALDMARIALKKTEELASKLESYWDVRNTEMLTFKKTIHEKVNGLRDLWFGVVKVGTKIPE